MPGLDRLVYVAGDKNTFTALVGRWQRERMAGQAALEAIARARAAITAAEHELEAPVGAARATGGIWEEIARAAGMRRLSAHERCPASASAVIS
ncbi:hypothetical protein GCM10022237_28790 [Nocardioides ginsengisoli]|uniref:Uncharacterized protein n=1 Tax=Nocardioides ginsengisoli TaxID=363868 RepID=A0ABW3W3D5_9ACTN